MILGNLGFQFNDWAVKWEVCAVWVCERAGLFDDRHKRNRALFFSVLISGEIWSWGANSSSVKKATSRIDSGVICFSTYFKVLDLIWPWCAIVEQRIQQIL